MNELERLHVSADALAALCRDFGVVELSAFGSVLRPDFRPDSDVDLLVVFEKDRPVGLFHILRLQQRLAAAQPALDTQAVRLVEGLIAEHVAQGGAVAYTTHQEPRIEGRVISLDA